MAPALKLVYFNIRGRAEPIRLVLTAAGVDFEDKRIDFAEWPAMKPNTPTGQLPYIEMEGKTFFESVALMRFVARKYGLAGKDEIEALRVDEILCQVESIREKFVLTKLDPAVPDDMKKIFKERFDSKLAPEFFKKMETRLVESKSGFFVGDSVTLADLVLITIEDQSQKEFPEVLSGYPKLKEHQDKIKNLPKLKKYFENRLDTPI